MKMLLFVMILFLFSCANDLHRGKRNYYHKERSKWVVHDTHSDCPSKPSGGKYNYKGLHRK